MAEDRADIEEREEEDFSLDREVVARSVPRLSLRMRRISSR